MKNEKKGLKVLINNIIKMIKNNAFYSSIAISAIFPLILIWFVGFNPNFNSDWITILFLIFKTISYYVIGFFVIYLIFCMVAITIPKYEIKEKIILKFAFILVWINGYVIILMILGFFSAILMNILVKYLPKPITALITYSILIFLFTYIRDLIKEKCKIDLINIKSFFKD